MGFMRDSAAPVSGRKAGASNRAAETASSRATGAFLLVSTRSSRALQECRWECRLGFNAPGNGVTGRCASTLAAGIPFAGSWESSTLIHPPMPQLARARLFCGANKRARMCVVFASVCDKTTCLWWKMLQQVQLQPLCTHAGGIKVQQFTSSEFASIHLCCI